MAKLNQPFIFTKKPENCLAARENYDISTP